MSYPQPKYAGASGEASAELRRAGRMTDATGPARLEPGSP